MDVSSNEKDIAVLDRRPRQKNDFNKFQHKMKNEGKSGLANVVKEQYEALKEKQVRQKKQQEDHEHRALCNVNHFIRCLDDIPDVNKAKLEDSPFDQFLKLKNQKLQIEQVCATLSLCLQNDMKLKLLFKGKVDEELEVTKEHFSELMGIVEKEPTSHNQHVDPSLVKKFCNDKNENEIFMRVVKDVLKNVNEDEDHIKRAFALLAMRYIVCPPKSTALAQSMLRYVNDAKDLKNQPWVSLAMTSLQNGKYETGKTKNIGGCVFFLQLCLMRKYEEELDLFKLNDDQIKKFQIKWEEDYGHMCAREGYSKPLVNKIVRTMGEVCKILQDNEKPINMRCLMHTDESLEKFMSEAAALCRSQQSASESVAMETEDNALDESLQEQQGTQDASESVSIETQDNAIVAAHKQCKKRITKNAKGAHKPGKKPTLSQDWFCVKLKF
nr:hypothetical protein [Tanacetum cinerariifolium]